jgi:hypothetical protein
VAESVTVVNETSLMQARNADRAFADAGVAPVEIVTIDPQVAVDPRVSVVGEAPAGGASAGRGGAGRGGRAGAGFGAAGGLSAAERANGPTRWRILPSGGVESSRDGGATWIRASVNALLILTGGSSPSPSVCWLIGRNGTVLLTTDGFQFTRVSFPLTVDLVSIRAEDATRASVTTATGAVLTTTDAGATWR